MSVLPLSNSFNNTKKIYPYYIDVVKVSKDTYQYIPSKYSAIWDTVADVIFFDIKEKGKAQTLPSLTASNSRYFIYLECSFDSVYKINSATFKGSSSLLPLIDGLDGPEGFTQTYARGLISIIGQNGYVCQNYRTLLNTRLGILNGSPVVYIKSKPFSYPYEF
jgi:hypothetical protein